MDPNNDSYIMDLSGLPEFIEFDPYYYSLSLATKTLSFDDIGNYTIDIQLMDNKTYENTY